MHMYPYALIFLEKIGIGSIHVFPTKRNKDPPEKCQTAKLRPEKSNMSLEDGIESESRKQVPNYRGVN